MATVRIREGARRSTSRVPRSAGEWRTMTLTGLGLLVLVTVHMVANHFVVKSIGGLRDYQQVLAYIANPAIFTIESLFLLFVTVHAMLGLRRVLLDLDPGPRVRRWIDRGLAVLGLATLAYGYFLIGTLASRA
jgi:succinate dehydrogenase hydrophobic anchor subunit